jgi:transposase-like protein
MAAGVKCPKGHTRVWKKGVVPTKQGNKPRYVCFTCGRTFYLPTTKKGK